MYPANTILLLKEPRDPNPETEEEFPYNRVRVIGESPIGHTSKGKWEGADAAGVIIVPLTNFGATLDEPFGKLREIYEVEEIPVEDIQITSPKVDVRTLPRVVLGPTPEDVFKAEAPGVAPEEGQIRGRTPVSPLDGPDGPPEAVSPLGSND